MTAYADPPDDALTRLTHDRAAAYVAMLEKLDGASLDRLDGFVDADVRFSDPFVDVTGAEAMKRVFAKMFRHTAPVTFTVTALAARDRTAFAAWDFRYRLRGEDVAFPGTSRIEFGRDGKVTRHADSWDAARGFYEALPVVGFVLRRLRSYVAGS